VENVAKEDDDPTQPDACITLMTPKQSCNYIGQIDPKTMNIAKQTSSVT